MSASLAKERLVVLQIISSMPQGISWYGIATRLGRRGIHLQTHLMSLLRALEADGLIEHQEAEGYPHGLYFLTEQGRSYLERA